MYRQPFFGSPRARALFVVGAFVVLACGTDPADPSDPADPPVSITTSVLADGIEGVAYGPEPLSATGGNGTYSWSLAPSSGPLPTGLTLGSNGQISGTPSTAGSFDFTVRAASGNQSADKALAIQVVPALMVTTASLLSGTVGVPYGPETLAATGGVGAYTWSLAAASDPLPDGLTLSAAGEISGTPTTAGTANITVQVTSGAQSAQAPLAVEIRPAAIASGILFGTDRDGNWEIYWMAVDGSNPTNLTNDPATDLHPSPSPDGSRIAFNSTRMGGFARIWAMDADGSNPAYLTVGASYNDHEPDWSPAGSKIAFYATRDGNEEIYSMDTDGSNQTRLTATSPYAERGPAWSPDGSTVAFTTNRDGNWEVYRMDANGGNQVNLTGNGADDRDPAWSPDGSKIAFTSLRNPDGIYVMDADGSNPIFLTAGWSPSWSPDGTKIAFVSSRDGDNEIYVMDADGSNVVRLTFSPGGDAHPVWTQ